MSGLSSMAHLPPRWLRGGALDGNARARGRLGRQRPVLAGVQAPGARLAIAVRRGRGRASWARELDRRALRQVAHRGRVHAEAHVRRRRTVVEDVAEVPVAARAADLDAAHAVGAIVAVLDGVLRDRRGERRPPGAGLELLAGAEERVPARGADVRPRLLRAEEAA